MAAGSPLIEPLVGKREHDSIRLIVAGGPAYHRGIVDSLARDMASLIDLAGTEEALVHQLEREEFDCLIIDQRFGVRSTLELLQIIDQRIPMPPAVIIVTDQVDRAGILKAFRAGVSDVVLTGPNLHQDLTCAIHRAAARIRKMRSMSDEIDYLSKLARYDRQTGVPTREFLEDRLANAIAAARRHGGTLALLLIELSNLQEITDIYGQATGDHVLRAFAHRLMQASRTSDSFGRLGGNEFLYLIDHDISTDSVELACARLTATLSFAAELESVAVMLSATVGAAIYPADGDSIDDLVDAARQAVLVVKGGRKAGHLLGLLPSIAEIGGPAAAPVSDQRIVAGRREADRRVERRARVLRRGRIILGDGYSTIDCIIHDISSRGARITVQDGIVIPRTMSLAILDTGRTHQAVRRWQRGPRIGVEFTAPAAEQTAA